MKIISFGEKRINKDSVDQWYMTESGEKVKCDESMINSLWQSWIIRKGSHRADKDGYTIFNFGESFNI